MSAPPSPLWHLGGLALKVIGVTVSLASLLVIYLPDMPVVGRWFYPLHYKELIQQHAQTYGLDPLLVAAVIRQESGFRPTIRSAVGARGLMQLMPETATWGSQRIGIKNFKVEQLDDPAVNIRVGCWYLHYLFQQFKETDKVLAAYNGGEGNVSYWGKQEGEQLAYAYPETQTYVASCLRSYRRYKELYKHEIGRVTPRQPTIPIIRQTLPMSPGPSGVAATQKPGAAPTGAPKPSAKPSAKPALKPTPKPTPKPSPKPSAQP